MIIAAIIGLIVSMAMVIVRAVIGETAFDRILAANIFGTNVIVFIVIVGHLNKTDFMLDVALTYSLVNFITTIAFLRYYKYREEQ